MGRINQLNFRPFLFFVFLLIVSNIIQFGTPSKQHLFMDNTMILLPNEAIISPNNRYHLSLNPSGNLELKDSENDILLWETNSVLNWPIQFWVELYHGRLNVEREAPESENENVRKFRGTQANGKEIPSQIKTKEKFKETVWTSSMLQGEFLNLILRLIS